MPNYRRWKFEGAQYFLTVVTHEHRPIFAEGWARQLLRKAVGGVRAIRPFEMTAVVLLPDHFHMVWQLPDGDSDFSTRMGGVKYAFTRAYLAAGGQEGAPTRGRERHRNRGVWQKRFHEHWIRDDRDFARHFDYVHYNPVKHGYVDSPAKWPWSSFHRYVRLGLYDPDWCDPRNANQLGTAPDFE
jgi:putative transposase